MLNLYLYNSIWITSIVHQSIRFPSHCIKIFDLNTSNNEVLLSDDYMQMYIFQTTKFRHIYVVFSVVVVVFGYCLCACVMTLHIQNDLHSKQHNCVRSVDSHSVKWHILVYCVHSMLNHPFQSILIFHDIQCYFIIFCHSIPD